MIPPDAFEVIDLDAVEMGQQVMMARRYRHAWGSGGISTAARFFDCWRDPWGQKHEHYTDGDLFDARQPAGYHVLDRAGLYQWAPTCPTTSSMPNSRRAGSSRS